MLLGQSADVGAANPTQCHSGDPSGKVIFLDGGLGFLGKASEGFPKMWGCQNGFMGQPVGVQLMLASFQGCLSLGMVRHGFTQEKKKKKKGLKGSSRSLSSPSTREVLALWKPQC